MTALQFVVPPLSETDWAAFAKRALSGWGIGEITAIEKVSLPENVVFKILASSRGYALRLHRPGYHTQDAVESELMFMNSLTALGLACPETIETRGGLLTYRINHATTLKRFEQNAGRLGLIHADMHPNNVLVDGEQVRVIDFDDCGTGFWLYDLASTLTASIGKPDYHIIKNIWLSEYHQSRTIDPDTDELLDALGMARLLKLLGWLETRPDTLTSQIEGASIRRLAVYATQRFCNRRAPSELTASEYSTQQRQTQSRRGTRVNRKDGTSHVARII